MSRICSKCGAELKDNASFCTNCGSDISAEKQTVNTSNQYCGKCGALIKPDSTFCTNCGNSISNNAQSVNTTAQVSEMIKDFPVKKYAGIILSIVLLIISLFPLLYNPEFCMNGNLFMLFLIFTYLNVLKGFFGKPQSSHVYPKRKT